MPMHHRVLLAAHDGSLGAVRVIRVQKGGVTIETITELSNRERKRERERERERKKRDANTYIYIYVVSYILHK